MHTECQWDKDNSLAWFGDFFLFLEERKMTGNPGLQKIVNSSAQRNFLLLLGQHPYNGDLFLPKGTKTSCGYGGQYALSYGSFPCLLWCQYSFPYALFQLPQQFNAIFSSIFTVFWGFLFMYIFFNKLNVFYNLVSYPWGGRTPQKMFCN